MTTISILNPTDQPAGKKRLLHEMKDCLESQDYDSFRIIVAFAKQGPLLRLEQHIENWLANDKTLEAIYGIDANGTSIEALDFSLKHFSEVRIAHATPSSYSSTFHPKIYFFRGSSKSKVYIGSNNLTVGGLESNFESYVCLEMLNSEDLSLIESIESMWKDTKDSSKKLDVDFFDTLKRSGILPTEQAINIRGAKEKRLIIGKQTINKQEFDFPYLAIVPPSKPPVKSSVAKNVQKAKYIVFRYLTAADFFNIYKPRGTERRGGGQSYIDIHDVSLKQWNVFFGNSSLVTESMKTNGPSWKLTVNSIGQEESQDITIYQRRAHNVVIASQKITSTRENRVKAWHPENGFPEPLDPTDRNSVSVLENLLVFIARTTDGKFWAGWTIDKDYKNARDKNLRQMVSGGKDGHSGFIESQEGVEINIGDVRNPFSLA